MAINIIFGRAELFSNAGIGWWVLCLAFLACTILLFVCGKAAMQAAEPSLRKKEIGNALFFLVLSLILIYPFTTFLTRVYEVRVEQDGRWVLKNVLRIPVGTISADRPRALTIHTRTTPKSRWGRPSSNAPYGPIYYLTIESNGRMFRTFEDRSPVFWDAYSQLTRSVPSGSLIPETVK